MLKHDGDRCAVGLIAALAMMFASGCDGEASMADAGTMDTGDAAPLECPGMGGPGELGDPCRVNDDCASGVCSIFRDAPRNDDAVCVEAPAECGTRMMGTLLDFGSLSPMAGMPLLVVGAHDAIVAGPQAEPIVVLETDANGRYDGATDQPIDKPLAVLALTATAGFVLTASGLVQPMEGTEDYPVGAGLHDVWCVPTDLLASWSDALAGDEAVPSELLPLPGPGGAVVGLVRDPTGQPIAGAVISSLAPDSTAIVRYDNGDGTLGAEATSASGKFVILASATPELFVASAGGQEVGRAVVGLVPEATFVTVLQHLE